MIQYISTRGGTEPQNFEDVLLTGLAPDGGLFVPESWPQFSRDDFEALRGKSYIDIAEAVMYPFVEGSIPREDFREILEKTYSAKNFRHDDIVPLHAIYDDKLYAMELFHGPTIAFKDVALQLLGHLFDYVLKKRQERITIVGATSGDTGSAAIEGCKVSDQLDIFILHPAGRVSDVQRKQMTSIKADNVFNIALEGNFDDCQNLVKDMFNDSAFRAEMNLSAINSINWARIMAQIVYYVDTALKLGAPDKDVTFSVPTGNFGNVFAAYAARQMGFPIHGLNIATNKNDILTRFFETGKMTLEGVDPSISPSMDIQISSNFERYLFDLVDRDAGKLKELMEEFKASGTMTLPDNLMQKARAEFTAFRTDESQTSATIKKIFEDTGYMLDPHTAVGVHGSLGQLDDLDDNAVIVSLACAHPAKFPDAVKGATGEHPELPEHLSDLLSREEFLTQLPNDLERVQNFVRENAHNKTEPLASHG